MTLSVLHPHCSVVIGGVTQDAVFEWHTDLELNTIATADLSMPFPAGAEITEGATVTIDAAADTNDAERRVFSGRIASIGTGLSDAGMTTHLQCVGHAWALSLPLEQDIAFAGGAPIDARLLSSSVLHIGNTTISWYADSSPDGLSVDLTFSPRVDARFVRVTGIQHGANSYQEEPDRDISDFSRIEVWQEGRRRGYANLPSSGERWRDQLDYTDVANWTAFDLTIGASINDDAGDVTIRFVSGRKPGSNERDDYEVTNVVYETAGRMSARQLVRSVLRNRGYGATHNGVSYRVHEITDIHDDVVELGGNGLVNNGRITLTEKTQPWSWLVQSASLWGYALVDGPDALDVLPVRGDPGSRTPQATFVVGDNLFSIQRSRDTSAVKNDWRVYGASGSDEQGEPFRYQSFSDPDAITRPAWLPNPPGTLPAELRSDLLVSDKLARSVRQVQEIENEAIPLAFELEVPPSPKVKPGRAVWVTAPDEHVDRLMWVTAVRHDWDTGGFWTALSVRYASGRANREADPAIAPRTQPDSGTFHIGQADRSWYARSNPDGLAVALAFDPGVAVRGVRVTGRYHGANSFASGSAPETWSTVEIWQLGVMLGSVDLPIHPERAASRLAYSNDAYWADFDVMIAADLLDTAAQVGFSSGTARDSSRDEFEVKGVEVALYAEATEQGPVPQSGADWHAYEPRRVYRWAS